MCGRYAAEPCLVDTRDAQTAFVSSAFSGAAATARVDQAQRDRHRLTESAAHHPLCHATEQHGIGPVDDAGRLKVHVLVPLARTMIAAAIKRAVHDVAERNATCRQSMSHETSDAPPSAATVAPAGHSA